MHSTPAKKDNVVKEKHRFILTADKKTTDQSFTKSF